MLASGFLALAGSEHLDSISQAALLLALAARAAKVSGWLRIEWGMRAISIAMFAAICFYPLDYWYVSGSAPWAGLHLAAILTALKLLTAKTDRDYMYLKLIAVVELMAAAMLAVNLGFFVFLASFLLFTVATLASGEVRRSAKLKETVARAGHRAFSRRLSVTSAVLCGGILFMTAGLFFVLPRAARGALSGFMPDGPHLPGFADKVTLGDIGRIQQSSRTVMHIRADSGENLNGLYWRGGALTRFDGKTWDNPASSYGVRLNGNRGLIYVGRALKTRPGREIGYEVQLDEIASDTLFFAGQPETIVILSPVWRNAEGAFHVQGAPPGLIYRAFSYVEDERAPAILPPGRLSSSDRADLTQLPDLDPRIPALARAMAGDAVTDEDKTRAIERRLRHDFGYTLELPSKPVRDPLAYFLFVRKKGHCEYFASAMAVMLRSLGIPARVATGFQSGVFNPLTGWQVVRASDAHSWVEAWLDDSGWTLFDPTPPSSEFESQSLFGRASLLYDAANQFWRDWVLRYDLSRQVTLASRLHQWKFDSAPGAGGSFDRGMDLIRRAAPWLIGAAAAVIVLLFFGPDLVRWWRSRRDVIRVRRGEGQVSDATMLYQRMLMTLQRRGFQKPAWITPAEFVRVLPESEMAVLVEDLTSAYNELRFGGRLDAAGRMVRMLDRLDALER